MTGYGSFCSRKKMSKRAASNILVARACVDSESVGVFFEELEKSDID